MSTATTVRPEPVEGPAKKNTVSSYLHVATLLRLLVVLLLVLAPHMVRLPWWETAAVLAVVGWRALAARRHFAMPGKLIRAALTLAAFAAVYASYGRINGQHAGVALLVVMAALKLTEMEQRRDVMVLVFLMYFVCTTHFLFSQELWTLVYLLLAAIAVTTMLIESNHAGVPLPLKVTLRRGGLLVAQAIPLMLLMFVLFPRVPGPLWGLPSDAGAGRSGLSDRMAPGDIAALILNDELAFRVRFDGAVPAQNQLYWRGPVFWDFDGREWTEGGPPYDAPYRVQLQGAATSYEVTLEPNRTNWLFALDAIDLRQLPADSMVTVDGRLLAAKPIRERIQYRAVSRLNYLAVPELPPQQQRMALRLSARNPRAQALARGWRAEGRDDEAIVQSALLMFRNEQFFYTLKPPILEGDHPVDEFLFNTRKGFCEHYASAFTTLMRAAGVPARVVTGYQGGARNAIGDYYTVRQSDAHAWSEVWLAGKGWLRVDPTAAVAPNRVEKNLESALGADEALPFALRRSGSALFTQLEARWDWVNAQWNRWVLAYGPELQKEFLGRFGLEGWRDLMLAMIVALSLATGVFGLVAIRRALPVRSNDPALRLWQQALARLKRDGLIQRPHEGPQVFVARVIEQRPELAAELQPLLAAYLAARYLGDGSAAPDLAARARAFKPSRIKPLG
ncbi:MAG: DUF3488 and transglutaminase-like domain-containing protein [Pseudomonadota bacterium]